MRCKGIFVLSFFLLLLFGGCGKDDTTKQNDAEIQTEEQRNANGQSDENDQPSNEEGTSGEDMLEPEVANVGEGAQDGSPMDVKESDSYEVGDVISMTSGENVLYELTIDEIAYTDARDEYTQDPGDVILVTYTYKNLGEDTLIIDDMRFQLMQTDETTLYDSYYLSDMLAVEPLEKGNSCTAQIAYAVPEKTEEVVLAYQDTIHTELQPVKIRADNLQ